MEGNDNRVGAKFLHEQSKNLSCAVIFAFNWIGFYSLVSFLDQIVKDVEANAKTWGDFGV